jgi:lysophospholipase L1-like esterase
MDAINIAKTAMASFFQHAHPVAVLAGAVLFLLALAAGIVTVVEVQLRKPFARLLTQLSQQSAAHLQSWIEAWWQRLFRLQTRRAAAWGGMCAAVLLVGVEGVLRVSGFGHPVLLQGDAEVGYLFQASQYTTRLGHNVHINAFHQRSDDVTALPTVPNRRVLIVGDSVTFGTTLLDQNETISERLRSALNARGGSTWEVLNASAGSWGPGNELAYLQRFGTFGAQEVVLQIGSHDLLQIKSTSARVGIDPSMPNRRPLTAMGEVWSRYLWPRWRGLAAPAYPTQPNGEAAAAQFENNLRSVCEMIRLIRECGAVPIVLHTPNRNEVVAESAATPSEYAPWRERFLALLEAQDVTVINLAELWASDPNAASYYLDHVHLSPRGTIAAAQTILTPVCSPARAVWSVAGGGQ